MKIELFERHLTRETGFFRFIFRALIQCRGARVVDKPRPLPRVTAPRAHDGAWARFDGHLVFFDLSDHVFLFDLDALKLCSVYFKTNLHWGVARKLLAVKQLTGQERKIVPFTWFAGNLDVYRPDTFRNRLRGWRRRPMVNLCHIVGVYQNLVREGEPSPFHTPGNDTITPSRYHFWIRYHIAQALQSAGISGHYRLTSRGNRAIEDGHTVLPNLSERRFMDAMLGSQFTVINTLPHALLPWKASESLMLGRPFIVERAPLVEMPQPFRPTAGVHYLELLPNLGGFDQQAPLEDPRSYRVLSAPQLHLLAERIEWLKSVIEDRERVAWMQEAARTYAAEVLTPDTVSAFVCDHVNRMIA